MKALDALQHLGLDRSRPCLDSRLVRPGDLFMACPGVRGDGRDHIGTAIAAGAAGVLWEAEGGHWDPRWQIPNAAVPGLRDQLGLVASALLGYPSQHLWVAAVTGTNGKTTCAHWIADCLTRLGRPAGVIGTLGNGVPGQLRPATHTTPDAVALQQELALQSDEGLQACAIEASSHALDQGRLAGVAVRAALFTNLTRDHLDYHGTTAAYGAAKARLFRMPGLEAAVLNVDDPFGGRLASQMAGGGLRLIRYGESGVEVGAEVIRADRHGLSLNLRSGNRIFPLQVPVLGRFNVANLLGVFGVLLAAGIPADGAVAALAGVRPVAGRLQSIDQPGRPLVVIDYAHTPDALDQVLTSLRPLVAPGGRLHCVFGCGGERDAGKRPLMGSVARNRADVVVLTSDNPRSEDPLAIIAGIRVAVPDALVVPERREAIAQALSLARPGDVVLVAGKGHEQYQELADVRLPFSDLQCVQSLLAGDAHV